MARFEIQNIIVGALSPRRYNSPRMTESDALSLLIDKKDELEAKGWRIYDIFENELFKGIRLKVTDSTGFEAYVSLSVRKHF